MLLTKTLKIQINKGNIPRYKQFEDLKYLKIGDTIDIPIKYISLLSREKVLVKCDICEKEYKILYKTYNESTNNQKDIYVCRGKCTNIKRETTNLELYGVKNCFQNEIMKEKSKETMKEKYGHEFNMQCEKFLDDRKETYMKNWGVDIKLKKEKTCIKNYGVKSPYQNHEILCKSHKNANSLKKYKNTDLYYQSSYEKDFLDQYYDKIKITSGICIHYFYDKERTYHSDYYIKELNLVIEIKSTYWLNKFKTIVDSKELYTRKQHKYILILDKNYDEFDNLIKNLR